MAVVERAEEERAAEKGEGTAGERGVAVKEVEAMAVEMVAVGKVVGATEAEEMVEAAKVEATAAVVKVAETEVGHSPRRRSSAPRAGWPPSRMNTHRCRYPVQPPDTCPHHAGIRPTPR